MNNNNNHTTRIPISDRNVGVVDFIKKEIEAKKARHAAIRRAIKNGEFTKGSSKVACSK